MPLPPWKPFGAMTDEFQSVGNGAGPNPARQEGPHAHQIITDLDGNHVFGVDLGADKVNVLNLDPATGAFSPNTVPFTPIASGSGPRHMAFHPDRQHAYVLDELVSSITAFDYDPARAAFIWKQTISTLPPDFSGTNTTAEFRVHPSGRFLYNTNRGHNSVTMYEIDRKTGELDVIGWEFDTWAVAARDEHRPFGNFSMQPTRTPTALLCSASSSRMAGLNSARSLIPQRQLTSSLAHWRDLFAGTRLLPRLK